MPRGIFHPVLTTVVLTTKELTLAKECPAVPPIDPTSCPTTYEDGTMLTCDYGEESCCLEEGGPVQTFPSMSCVCKDGWSLWSCLVTDACYASALNNCADELPSSLDQWDDASSSGCPNEVPNSGDNCTANNDGAAETTTLLTCNYGTESCCYEEGGPLQIFPSLTCECESSDQSTWVCYFSDACDIPEQYTCEGEDDESTDDGSSQSCFGSFLQRLLGGQAYF